MAIGKDQPPIPVPPVEPPPASSTAGTLSTPLGASEQVRPDPYANPDPTAPYQQYQGLPYNYGAYVPARPQGLSIASMICGIAGIVLGFSGFGFFPGVAAIITGHLAQKRQPYARGFWITGLITGYVSAVFGLIVGLIVIVAIVAAIASSASYNY
jgi:hypothetical protein